MPNLDKNEFQRTLITPIDTVLFESHYLGSKHYFHSSWIENEVDLHEWNQKLGKYKRIRVKKAKRLKSQVFKNFYSFLRKKLVKTEWKEEN